MDIKEFLTYLEGVSGSGKQYSALCPAHDDHNASLSVSTGQDGKIIMKCHAGCEIKNILDVLGLQESDLFSQSVAKEDFKRDRWELIARYNYTDEHGNFLFQKTRWKTPTGKSFTWSHQENGRWVKGRGGKPVLYNLREVTGADTVYLVEGEKDVETLKTLGYVATSPPDGAASDWQPQYTEALRGKTIYIVQDNDKAGKDFAIKAANVLQGTSKLVKIIDLTQEWDKLPEHGDTTDAYCLSPEDFTFKFDGLVTITPEFDPDTVPELEDDEDLSVTCLANVEEKEADWLIDGYIPCNQITTMAGDGGVGKTTIWCSILADISSGRCPLFLKGMIPFARIAEPEKVMFFSAEDSAEEVLKAKIRKHGGEMDNVFYIDIADDRFEKIKFDSTFLEKLIKKHRPALVVFDPLQAFIPDRVKMSERNAMRSCMAHLIGLGKKYGCTFLIIVHSNKQSGVWGRKRIADSADIWDISRSVFTAGETNEPGIRYISHEKSNYGRPGSTVLFAFDDDDVIQFKGYSDKKDKDFVGEAVYATVRAPQSGEAKQFILDFLKDGEKPVKELDGMAAAQGISKSALRRGKEELKTAGAIQYRVESGGKCKGVAYFVSLVEKKNCS